MFSSPSQPCYKILWRLLIPQLYMRKFWLKRKEKLKTAKKENKKTGKFYNLAVKIERHAHIFKIPKKKNAFFLNRFISPRRDVSTWDVLHKRKPSLINYSLSRKHAGFQTRVTVSKILTSYFSHPYLPLSLCKLVLRWRYQLLKDYLNRLRSGIIMLKSKITRKTKFVSNFCCLRGFK